MRMVAAFSLLRLGWLVGWKRGAKRSVRSDVVAVYVWMTVLSYRVTDGRRSHRLPQVGALRCAARRAAFALILPTSRIVSIVCQLRVRCARRCRCRDVVTLRPASLSQRPN